jgi:hypothetical protein
VNWTTRKPLSNGKSASSSQPSLVQNSFELSTSATGTFIHHIRTVFTITDTIPMPCENHSQIVRAKRVPASRGAQVFRVNKQTLFDILSLPNGA